VSEFSSDCEGEGGGAVAAEPMSLPGHRFGVTPGFRSDFVGFRVARDLH